MKFEGKRKIMNYIFDLDGTLINSKGSVIKSLIYAFNKANVELKIDEKEIKIGPPLDETILMCNNSISKKELFLIKDIFKEYYDNFGFKEIHVFKNIDYLLSILSNSENKIYIATNKRYTPTKKIINYLGWNNFFKNIYCIDRYKLNEKSKKSMLDFLIKNENIESENSLYIGDRYDDFIASKNNMISFIGAGWGENDFEDNEKEFKIIYNLTSNSINYFVDFFK